MNTGQVDRLLNVEQSVAVLAHAQKRVLAAVGRRQGVAVVIQGNADPVHIGVAWVIAVHIHLIGAAEIGGVQQSRPGTAGTGNLRHMPVGGNVLLRGSPVRPDVHLAADANEHWIAQGIQIGERFCQLGIIASGGKAGTAGAFLRKIDVHQKGPFSALQNGTVQIGPVFQAVGLCNIIIEGYGGFLLHLVRVNQSVAAIAQRSAQGGAAIIHAAAGLILSVVKGIVGARGLRHGVNLRIGIPAFICGSDGGRALIRERLKRRQTQDHRRG